MSWDPTSLLAELTTATERFDNDKVSCLCREIVAGLERGEALAPATARQILSTLRKKAHFGPMEQLAETLYFTGQDDIQIRRQYAQALIDQHKFPAAVYVLESLITRTVNDPEESAEARGLLGRVYKQLYVNAVNADRGAAGLFITQRHLRLAVESYLGVYRSDETRYLWHGINAVALIQRASRDGVALPTALDASELTHAILAGLARRGARKALSSWDLATGAEASLALGDTNEALLWLAQYIQRQDVDAFELASTMRQLTEVWGLEIGTMPGALLLPLLQSQLLQRKGGRIALSAGEVSSTLQRTEEHAANVQLEKVLGKEGVVTLGWYKIGLDRAQVVAKILNPVGDGFGTGFLIRGGDLLPALGDETLLLTNAHVVSSDADIRTHYGSLDPDDAMVLFEDSE
ncbi:MAG TPA: TRAFs-binding domain-containing protein, partial [Thermoanaerobaculia bacterium]